MNDDSTPDPELLELFPPLGMSGQEVLEAATASPVVDAIKAAMQPDHFVAEPDAELSAVAVAELPREGKEFTSWERRPLVVADEITRVIHEPGAYRFSLPTPDEMAHALGVDYIHSDLPGRKVLPPKGRYSDSELRDELIHRLGTRMQSRREALAQREQRYVAEELAAACTGPIVKQVMLYSRVMPGFWSRVPWELAERAGRDPESDRGHQVRAAFPVPVGYSAYRVARLIADDFSHGCWWCRDDEDSSSQRKFDLPVMLVSTGGSLRCFSTCGECREAIGPGPDYYVPDGWDAQHGYPAEAYR